MKNFSLSPFFLPSMAISGLFLFFWLLGNQMLTSDDLYFATKIQSHSPWEAMQLEREVWNSRWTSLFFNFSILKIYQILSPAVLFLYGLFNGMLLIVLVYLILNRIQIRSKTLIALLAIIFFVGTFNVGEVWFWVASSTTYLTSTLLVGIIYLIVRQSTMQNWLGILLIFPCIYIGGCSLPIAGLFVFCLMYSTLKSLKSEQPFNIQWSVLYTIVTLLSLLYLLDGKGSTNRMTHFNDISVVEALVLNFKLTAIVVYTYILPKLPILIFISFPLLFIPLPYSTINSRKLTAELIVIGLKLLIGFYCYQLILTYITQDIGAARTLFPMNILFVIGLLGLFFWLNRYLKSITIPPFLPVVLNGLSVISIVLLTYQQIRQTNHYSTQLEKRNEHLMTNNSIPHLLEPLPPSGYLYSSEISADSNHYSNQHLKLYFELKYAPIITTQQ